jgi:hypothetical protein
MKHLSREESERKPTIVGGDPSYTVREKGETELQIGRAPELSKNLSSIWHPVWTGEEGQDLAWLMEAS